MKKETIATGKTVAAAVKKGASELGVSVNDVTYDVLTEPKKGFLGIGEVLAKVKVTFEQVSDPADVALAFVKTMAENMELDANVELVRNENSATVRVTGGDSAALIGHHGETLDQLQYLVNLAANRRDRDDDNSDPSKPKSKDKGKSDYLKITVDVEDYRAKREKTLRTLARKMAAKVVKYKKNVALEPMPAYERRIIHSEIQNIPFVTTTSVGQENNRRVVISYAPDKT